MGADRECEQPDSPDPSFLNLDIPKVLSGIVDRGFGGW